MSAKAEILARIHGAHSVSPYPESDLSRGYIHAGQLTREAVIDLFVNRLEDYGASVYRCSGREISATIAAVVHDRGKSSMLIPPVIPSDWIATGVNFVPDDVLSYEDLDLSEGVLTGCALAIALTGTIILRHSAESGRRALTLIPDYHLCVVFEYQVVETVPEAIRAMSHFTKDPITTISGPSATSDIEMTRIKGVHGPRTLDVILASKAD